MAATRPLRLLNVVGRDKRFGNSQCSLKPLRIVRDGLRGRRLGDGSHPTPKIAAMVVSAKVSTADAARERHRVAPKQHLIGGHPARRYSGWPQGSDASGPEVASGPCHFATRLNRAAVSRRASTEQLREAQTRHFKPRLRQETLRRRLSWPQIVSTAGDGRDNDQDEDDNDRELAARSIGQESAHSVLFSSRSFSQAPPLRGRCPIILPGTYPRLRRKPGLALN